MVLPPRKKRGTGGKRRDGRNKWPPVTECDLWQCRGFRNKWCPHGVFLPPFPAVHCAPRIGAGRESSVPANRFPHVRIGDPQTGESAASAHAKRPRPAE